MSFTTRSGRTVKSTQPVADLSPNIQESKESIPYDRFISDIHNESLPDAKIGMETRRPGPQRNLASNRFESSSSRMPTVRLSNKKKSRKRIKRVHTEEDMLDSSGNPLTEEEARKKKRRQRSEKKLKRPWNAYQVWGEPLRKKILSKYPDMDLGQVSSKLAEMWRNVPESEKASWRAKARMLAGGSFPPSRPGRSDFTVNHEVAAEFHRLCSRTYNEEILFDYTPSLHPISTATYFKLLGESLTTVGEKLLDHKGSVAINGSLSVILDSVLCMIGPMLCLTHQIPNLACLDKAQLGNILESIVYIMPGL